MVAQGSARLAPALVLLMCAAIVWNVTSVAAQEPAPAPDVVGELGRIQVTLGSIASSLEELRRQQGAMLLIRRLELEERRLAPRADELRRLETEARSLEQEATEMEALLLRFREQHEQEVRDGLDPRDPSFEQEAAQAEARIESLRARQESARARTMGLENELARKRRLLEALEELFDEEIESMR